MTKSIEQIQKHDKTYTQNSKKSYNNIKKHKTIDRKCYKTIKKYKRNKTRTKMKKSYNIVKNFLKTNIAKSFKIVQT